MQLFFTILKHELLLTGILFLLLLLKIGSSIKNEKLLPLIQILLVVNCIIGFVGNTHGNLFANMFYSNTMLVLQKNILNIGVFIISLLFTDCFKKTQHLAEYFVLLLSVQLGLFLLISSGNFLLFYLALELATIPLAAMVNFDTPLKRSSEAGMKMILSSAFSSGILLFGISLMYGVTGTISFSELPALINGSPIQVMAFVFLLSAFAFKLSIVPFHFWTADVYEGAAIPTTAFLAVISKSALAFAFIAALYKVFQPIAGVWYNMILLLAITTMLVGNFFALRQQNIKRFLAFSSVAQVGFILVGISSNTNAGIASVIYFSLIYIFSNLAAFGVVAVINTATNKESIDDYKGLATNNKFLSWMMAIALFSLAGIPPTAGFFGKLFLISAGAAKGSYAFIIFAALNIIISLYYYLRVVRAMFMDKNETPIEKITINSKVKLGLLICGIAIVVVGLAGWIYEYIVEAIK
jgi:NADH-quinone oxidoreductase subunit N